MANNLTSNITDKVARVFLTEFESSRVASKTVDTQLLKTFGFDPSTGDRIRFKRPHDYRTESTPDGNLVALGSTASDIISGTAEGRVQNYITVEIQFGETEQSLELDQLTDIIRPVATRIVTELELRFGRFMMANTALLSGTFGTPIVAWDDVAQISATMQSHGIPQDMMWNFLMNPFTMTALASDQRSLGAGGVAGGLIKTAHERALVTSNLGGMDVFNSTTLASYTSGAEADRVGAMAATPDGTYVGAKDTMTQVLSVDSFGAGATEIFAGETVQITAAAGDVNRLNLNTREVILDAAGAPIIWTATVTADVTLVAGAGLITVTGPAISESPGQYNTATQPIVITDVVTLLGVADQVIQPNLFYHPKAFSIGSVPIDKLFSTDTLAKTEDGLMIRVSKNSVFRENKQLMRFDLHPAFAVLNPFFAGQAFAV